MLNIVSELRPAEFQGKPAAYPYLKPLARNEKRALNFVATKPPLLACLLQALEGVAQGMALLTEDSHLLYADSAAQHILAEARWSQEEGILMSSHPRETQAWLKALRHAVTKQTRSLVEIARNDDCIFVATMPVVVGSETLVLANFGPQASSSEIALQMFGQLHGLAGAEVAVLNKLAQGVKPARIAALHSVAVSTINTQLATIRTKTGCTSASEILVKLSRLPMLRPVGMLGVSVTMFG